ncbi:hypothetical protein DFH06DRAFT_1345849 [Mycena polygramma]|nr:hypothetical protein DFH06DRAFT_1345849 [Mycena polygramma]
MSRQTRNFNGCQRGAQYTFHGRALDGDNDTACTAAGMEMKDTTAIVASGASTLQSVHEISPNFEPALSPLRTPCCVQLFCTEHISTWIHGPISNGLCPVCRAPVYLPSFPSSSSSSSPSSPSSYSTSISDSEEEDLTDYSFPALQHARLMQTRRHVPHPLSSVLGLRGAVVSLARALGCVAVVAVLAGWGRWGV